MDCKDLDKLSQEEDNEAAVERHVLSQEQELKDAVDKSGSGDGIWNQRDELTHLPFGERELKLIKIAVSASSRRDVLDIASTFEAKAVDVSDHTITLQLTRDVRKMVALRRLLEPCGTCETIFELPWDIMAHIFDKIPRHQTDQCITVCRNWHQCFRFYQKSLRLDNPGQRFFPLRTRLFFNLVSLTLDYSLSDPPVSGQTTSTYNGEVVHLVTDQDLATVAVDCPRLERLQLFCCDLVTATGLTQVARECRGLEYIHLAHCRQFDDAGMLAVVNACKKLQHLEISFMEVSAAGIEALSMLTMVTAYDCPRSLYEI